MGVFSRDLGTGNALSRNAAYVVALECLLFALAYNALMPEGMYYSPDSILYLSVSNIVPATFALFARNLVKLELRLGVTHPVFLRYIMIAVYCAGGWLIARALIRSKRLILACFVLPAIWSTSALTMWFNYFLTDGLATGFLMMCIGAYANLHVSVSEGGDSASSRTWLLLFILLGMISFSIRPAFTFIGPAMIALSLSRAVFSWRRVVTVMLGVAILATLHFSFARYWHGVVPQQSGVLISLVFDLPLPRGSCTETNAESNVCRAQKALEPLIQEYNGKEPFQQKFIYKALNNGVVYRAAAGATKDENANSVLTDLALMKIRNNFYPYVVMVLKNSYASVKQWGDWYKWDNLGPSLIDQGIENTKSNAPAVRSKARLDFDPTITKLPIDWSYRNYLFQSPRLLLSGQFVADYTKAIFFVAAAFSVLPFLVSMSLPGSILFCCCIFSLSGTLFQNAVFPVIPRLLEPFQPLGALGALMVLAVAVESVKWIFMMSKRTPLPLKAPRNEHSQFSQ